MKYCYKCQSTLPLSAFGNDRSRKDGLSNRCKPCGSQMTVEWQQRNPEKTREKFRAWVAKDPEKERQRARRRYLTDPEKSLATLTAWGKAHPERRRLKELERRHANPEAVAAADKRWRENNMLKAHERSARYRARKKAATVEKVDYATIAERDQNVCHICGFEVDLTAPKGAPMSRSFDHVIPLSKGGEHSMLNVKVAHLQCNTRKNNKHRLSVVPGVSEEVS